MLQRTVFVNIIRMLQRTEMLQRKNVTTNSFCQYNQYTTTNTDATMKECYNEQFFQYNQDATTNTHATTNECYNERCYNERMLQRTVSVNIIRMLQRTQMLQRTRRNTIGRRSTLVCMMCRTFRFD